jgi:hypothetical protein
VTGVFFNTGQFNVTTKVEKNAVPAPDMEPEAEPAPEPVPEEELKKKG